MSDPYARHTQFIAPAAANPQSGSILIVVLVVEALFLFGPALPALFIPKGWSAIYFAGDTPIAIIAQLFSFAIVAYGMVTIIDKQHDRGFLSLIGPLAIALHDFRRCLWGVGVVLAVQILLPPWIAMYDLQEVRPIIPWLFAIPFALLAIVIQAGTEELFFRGYLQQQIAANSKSKLVWMGIPSLMFGFAHYFNGYGVADGLIYAVWATLLGLACADLTARTGSIGAAVGLHVANNLFAFIYVGVADWPASGLALFLYPYEDPYARDLSLSAVLNFAGMIEMIVAATMVFILWLAARIAIQR